MPVKPPLALSVLVITLATALAAPSVAGPKGKQATFEPNWKSAPSAKYGRLSAAACRSELIKRNITFTKVTDAPGVLAPVRIPEGVGGVVFHTLVLAKDRPTPWEVFDCRLVLALHDFSAILVAHAIDDVVIFSAWRPPPPKWPEGKLARRHPGALAVDVMRLRWNKPVAKSEGGGSTEAETEAVWIDVRKDFHGRIGDKTCGPKARPPRRKTPESKTLRAVVCEAAKQRLFTSILTPNHDRHHHDHLHLEVTPHVKWRMVR